jgi:acetolactate synthase-1/2/3 large subunit
MISGRPQAVMVHVDAGTLNLGCQLHNAQRNGTPVVVFAGRTPYSWAPEVRGHRDTYIHWQQEQLDQPAIVRNYAKWHMEVPRGRELAPIVRRAFQVAQSSPSGPVYVMLPREALMEAGAHALPRRQPPAIPPGPDPHCAGAVGWDPGDRAAARYRHVQNRCRSTVCDLAGARRRVARCAGD